MTRTPSVRRRCENVILVVACALASCEQACSVAFVVRSQFPRRAPHVASKVAGPTRLIPERCCASPAAPLHLSTEDQPLDGKSAEKVDTSPAATAPSQVPETFVPTTGKVEDDGLTDRFKYKVHALMGAFDPQSGSDDEYQQGNILNALTSFPARYSFSVVGRTNGDNDVAARYAEEVTAAVSNGAGGIDKDGVKCKVTPRGKSFTRVNVEVEVDSAAIVTSIYDALGDLELTVMRY